MSDQPDYRKGTHNKMGTIFTSSGRVYDFENPTAPMIHLEDIAHQLALINRWNGCTRVPYSVAQHSCVVAELVEDPKLKMLALMHDATEAYVGDMPSPMKHISPDFRRFEWKAWLAIAKKFRLPAELPPEIKKADNLALLYEVNLFMPSAALRETFPTVEVPEKILGIMNPAWGWQTAERTFLARYKLLSG